MSSSLVRELHEGGKADTRAAAAYVLGFGRFGSARASLEEVLNDLNEDGFVRGHAAEALAYLQNKDSAAVLLRHLNDRDLGVRYWCIFSLGQIGDSEALSAIKQIAESADDQVYDGHSLRTEALDAITEIEHRMKGV
jgi:HEAT repeat protein